MPRYNAANLAAVDPEFRKAHNIGAGGDSKKKSRYAYGKTNNVLVAAGRDLFANGLCLRLLPIYEEAGADADGNRPFANFREGRHNEAFGDWCRWVTCAHWVGNPGVCFIVHDGNPEVNLYESPLHVLRKVAWDNKDNHPKLGRLFTELLSKNFVANSHVGTLKKPEKTLFISASVVYVDDNGGITLGAFSDDQKRNARIVGLKTSALQSLHSALSVRDPDSGEHLSGDMLSFAEAKLVTFLPESYVSGGQKLMGIGAEGPETFHCPKHARSSRKDATYIVGYPQSRSEMTHFAVLHDEYQGQEISLEPYAERIVAETKSWNDYLWTPTYPEQAELIAASFPREVLDFAWREFPDYLRAIPKNTTTVEIGERTVEDMEEAPAPMPVKASGMGKPVYADPPAPWDPPAGEISYEAEASVEAMFSEPAIPPGASVPPPPAPKAAAPKPKQSSADVIARARKAANKG